MMEQSKMAVIPTEMLVTLVGRLLSVKECKVKIAGITTLKHKSESIALSNQFLYTLIIITVLNRIRHHMATIVAKSGMCGSAYTLALNAAMRYRITRTSRSRPVQ